MAFLGSLTWFTICFLVALFLCSTLKNRSSKLRRPPGPPGWPVLGNIFDLRTLPHQDFHRLESRYGPVLWLKLGNLNTLVVQSAAAAAELFKKHDLAFSDRKTPHSMTACDYIDGSLALGPYSEYCRIIRRLSSSELMIRKRINSSAQLRHTCIDKMIEWMKEDSYESRSRGGSGEIQFDKYLLIMSFNLVSNFMLTRDIMDFKSEKGQEFYEVMQNFMSWQGKPNLVDAFEFLKWLDPQGIRRHTEKHLVMVQEMFFGGTETTTNTTVRAMAELLRNPDSMMKLKAEIDGVVGTSRAVEDNDLNELTYLQAVVKESMRLHPALPLLLPRKARQDTEFMGYNISRDTTVIVNAWAIHRDPDSWEDPFSFKPQRFLNSSIDHKGQNYQVIPFGSGRRSCVGMLMGETMVSLTLARLIQSFDWELPADISPETLDVRETVGTSLRMLAPLKAVPREREA